MDYGKVLHFAFSWRKDPSFVKYAALVWALHLLFFAALAGISFFLFKNILIDIMSGSFSSLSGLWLQPETLGSMLIAFFFTVVPLYFFFLLAWLYAFAIITSFALDKSDFGYIKPDLRTFFVLFFLILVIPIASLISWFNKKMLVLPLASIIFAVIALATTGTISLGSAGLSIILAVVYLFVILYNLIRLSIAWPVFLCHGGFLFSSLEEAWEISENRIWSVILSYISVFIVVGIASFIIGLVTSAVLSFVLYPAIIPNFIIAVLLAVAISKIFLHPFQILSYCFACVAIYEQLAEED